MKHVEWPLGAFALIMMSLIVSPGCTSSLGGGEPGGNGQGGSGSSGNGPGGGTSGNGPGGGTSGSTGPSGSGPGGGGQGDCGGSPSCAVWSKSLGDTSSQSARGISIDDAGNVLIAGMYGAGGEIPMSYMDKNIFVAKLDSAGNLLWMKRFGDVEVQYANGIAADASGNAIITGLFEGTVSFGKNTLSSSGCWDIFVAKFDPAGNEIWSHKFGDAACQSGKSVAVDALDNVFVLGDGKGEIDFGGGTLAGTTTSGDVFLAKLGPTGNHLWSKRFDNAAEQSAESVAVDASGNVIISGQMNKGGDADFGGGPLVPSTNVDIFIAKFDSQGTHLWSDHFGLAQSSRLAADSAGNILALGYGFEGINFGGGPLDDGIFIAKLSAGGNHLWSRGFGGIIYSTSNQLGIASDGADNVLVTGLFDSPFDFGGGMLANHGQYDGFFAKFDPAGNHVWSNRFGGEKSQGGRGIAADSSGHVLLTGEYAGAIDLGLGPHVSAGQFDIFVAKLQP